MALFSNHSTAATSRHGTSADTARNRRTLQGVRDRAEALQKVDSDGLRALVERVRARVTTSTKRSRWSRSASDQTEAFALITEGVRRALGKTFYDVQLLGGIELAQGRIVQMQTGEGKTLTTALPAFARAIAGKRVHVATTNAYLAGRDCEELRPAFELLGMTIGRLPEDHDESIKRKAYQCDITFGTGYEFGFDFLRDQLAIRSRKSLPLGFEHIGQLLGHRREQLQPLQSCHSFAVVDEADSVLIDEATMPLILSSTAGQPATPEIYQAADDTASRLSEDDYECDPTENRLELNSSGWQIAHEALAKYSTLPLARPWIVYVQNALRSRLLLNRDIDYVVLDGAVQIVDQHTGRIHEERTWRDGLHQAIETREGVEVTAEADSDARITRQRYFQLYESIAGMTGTATGVERELQSFYGLSTSVVPTHRPCVRNNLPTRCFLDDECRNAAIVKEVLGVNRAGQPILVGTRTIQHSQNLSKRLTAAGMSHTVLNGLQDEEEAAVIARAGRFRALTIATNMAGRGTDISLESAAKEAGGLYVIGAEPNLSHRVDRQLSGRAARQGDSGTCRFFVAATDEIFAQDPEAPSRIAAGVSKSGEYRDDVSPTVKRLQSDLERRNFELRRTMVSRDRWLDDVLQTLAGREAS